MSRVAIIGVGNMGLAVAQRLLALGHAVQVHDIDPQRERLAGELGARVCADGAASAEGCTALILAVVDDAQADAALFAPRGAVEGLAAGSAVLLCPTLPPQAVERLAGALASHGIDCIDSPMSGGPSRARDGTMSLMVACADAAFERWQPLLRELSSRLFRIGTRPGDGARTKLVNNLLAAVNLAGAAEALALARHLGLDPAATLAVIEASSGQSWIGSDRLRRALADEPQVHAHAALLAKDSTLALAMAAAADFDTPLGRAAQRTFAAACAAGLSRADDSALWRWLAAGGDAALRDSAAPD